MKLFKIQNPEIEFKDNTLALDPSKGVYFFEERLDDKTYKVVGWRWKTEQGTYRGAQPFKNKKEIKIAILYDGTANEGERIRSLFEEKIKFTSYGKRYIYPGLEDLYDTKVYEDLYTLDELGHEVLETHYDVYLVVLRKKDLSKKLDVRYKLFLRGIPNKFILLDNLKRPRSQLHYSVINGLAVRAGMIPFVLSRKLTEELKERLGGEPTFIFLDSTRLDFLTGTFEMASACLVSGSTGIAHHGLFIVHKSEYDRMNAVIEKLNELKEKSKIKIDNPIIVAHGRISRQDLKVLKSSNLGCIVIEVTKSQRHPRLVLKVLHGGEHSYRNTPWGICLEHGEKYLINLTWGTNILRRGTVIPLFIRFVLPKRLDVEIKRLITKYLAWSSVLSPEAPVRFPSMPAQIHQADLLCKLANRLYKYLREKRNDPFEAIEKLKKSLSTLANKGLVLFAHGER